MMNRKTRRNKPGTARGRQKADTNVARPLSPGDTFLPHEHDESPGRAGLDGSEGVASRDPIAQAHRDVSSGLKDTDLRGTPSNVPTPDDADSSAEPPPHRAARGRRADEPRQ